MSIHVVREIEPLFYGGYIIQPISFDGNLPIYFVQSRDDTYFPESIEFRSLFGAKRYIDSRNRGLIDE